MSFSLRVTSVVGLTVALVGLGSAQAKAPQKTAKKPVAKAAQSHPEVATWRLSKLSPLALVQRADKALAAAKQVECETRLTVSMPKRRGQGQMTLTSNIQDGKNYALRFPALSLVKREELHTVRIQADGKQSQWLERTLPKPILQPISKTKVATNVKPEDWVLGHPRYIYGGVFGETPLTDLVRRASQRGSGFEVKVNERVIRRLNVPYQQYQLIIARNRAAEKKLGSLRIEMVIDAKQWLPVAIGGQALAGGKEPVLVINRLRWKFRKKPFEPGTFTLAGIKA